MNRVINEPGYLLSQNVQEINYIPFSQVKNVISFQEEWIGKKALPILMLKILLP